ncbi:kinase-like protein [Auriscalpium vulgare]|uniref:Kinase-like protein n=1 Tax=Auriscalpium vulgare TaxID=40419 RepID=A0ACB8SAQ7_9AGAM|nr:kinase-like protein [Auriscalpium vulgare]
MALVSNEDILAEMQAAFYDVAVLDIHRGDQLAVRVQWQVLVQVAEARVKVFDHEQLICSLALRIVQKVHGDRNALPLALPAPTVGEAVLDVPTLRQVSLPESVSVSTIRLHSPEVVRAPVPRPCSRAASVKEASPLPAVRLARAPALRRKPVPSSLLVSLTPTPSPSLLRTLCVDDFEPIKILGKGAFGTVYLTTDRHSGKQLALKVMSKSKLDAKLGGGGWKELLTEKDSMVALEGRKGFLPLHASWQDTENCYLATEYCPQGDLQWEITRWRKIPVSHTRFWSAQLIVALEKLHEARIVHRDIKPENILFDRDGNVMFADFGLARNFDAHRDGEASGPAFPPGLDHQGFQFTGACGTPGFMAPEVWQGRPYSFEVDVWSLGITIFYMLSGRMPFAVPDVRDLAAFADATINQPLRFEAWDDVDLMAQDFLQQVLDKDPMERLTLTEMKSHPFFVSINWDQMTAHTAPAPYIPFARNVKPTTCLVIPAGTPYAPGEDPCPAFTYVSPSLLEASSCPEVREESPQPPLFMGSHGLYSTKGRPDSVANVATIAPAKQQATIVAAPRRIVRKAPLVENIPRGAITAVATPAPRRPPLRKAPPSLHLPPHLEPLQKNTAPFADPRPRRPVRKAPPCIAISPREPDTKAPITDIPSSLRKAPPCLDVQHPRLVRKSPPPTIHSPSPRRRVRKAPPCFDAPAPRQPVQKAPPVVNSPPPPRRRRARKAPPPIEDVHLDAVSADTVTTDYPEPLRQTPRFADRVKAWLHGVWPPRA